MCGCILRRLKVRKLTAGAQVSPTSGGCRHREMIPLGSILSGLTQLTELSLSLGLCPRERGYSQDLRKLNSSQLRKITQGIAQCSQLQTLSLTRSDIDCDKIHILLESITGLEHLRSLNLGHCSIGDKGALQLSSFILSKPSCRELVLVNNKIGFSGAEGLAFALCQPASKVLALDVSCNTHLGARGVKLLLTALLRGTLLNRLKMSACGVYRQQEGVEVGGVLAAALAAGRTPLRELDISNNHLGQDSGGTLLAALETRGSSGPTVLLVRSCFLGRWEAAIQRATMRTAARRRAAQLRFKGGARRLLQAKRIARAIGIDEEVDPLQLARQLTARPSAASLPLSLTLSLSISQDVLLQDLPASGCDVVRVQIPPLKNPLHPAPAEAAKRRHSFPQCPRSGEGRAERRGSEVVRRDAEEAGTNIAIHLNTSHLS